MGVLCVASIASAQVVQDGKGEWKRESMIRERGEREKERKKGKEREERNNT